MKARMLSLLASVAMFGAVSAASAAEPTTLTENQLDAVSAGAVTVAIPAGTFTFTATSADVLASGSGSQTFAFTLAPRR